MNVGIVGHEAAKFTPETEAQAREIIRFLLSPPDAVLVSGHCHLGGIDIWAEEEAQALGRARLIHAPEILTWNDRQDSTGIRLAGFKTRNLAIANTSDIVHCIVVRELPSQWSPVYGHIAFTSCYHCKGRISPHVKSGGCWTAWRCPQHQWWIL